ncbi:hypothetical protein AG0111_0g5265 [Alternaria gaisen]|uniref:Uncharacterized protein n=1 Tax=Alternaria gaisen TaxID=167740 RepID=A0ACB6FRH7_9PLEO|nr:hypothetical protein AG0111_0g5265 [Alternaria gaisen]
MDILNLFHVQEMIAVVTGGGIGLMIAKALVSAGASKVYILGRRKDKLELAAAQHESLIPLQCDITLKESLQAAVDTIAKDVGFINLLVANSGILGPTSSFVPGLSVQELRKNIFEDTAMEEFAQTFHVNTTATYFSMFAFLELLDAGNKNALDGGFGKPLGEGSKVPSIQSQVIITSSVGAFLREWQCAPAYAGSKAAITHMVKHASTGLAPHGIRVNALAPGCTSSKSPNSRDLPLIRYTSLSLRNGQYYY